MTTPDRADRPVVRAAGWLLDRVGDLDRATADAEALMRRIWLRLPFLALGAILALVLVTAAAFTAYMVIQAVLQATPGT